MEVLTFSEANLALVLSNKYTSQDSIKEKNHFEYLLGYLNDLSAKTIVVEKKYVSKDYLHDYSSYYSLCFEKYPKFCKRIHFFSLDFNKDVFKTFISGGTVDISIRESYLGFIVVKPISHTVIGFTLLKTYSNSSEFNSRNFWGLKEFPVHLFGTKFTIESLAFQEQDSVLAACATTAIWSMLSKAIDVHTAVLKSPSQITKDSGNISFDGSRLFPNKGLDIRQICEAIYQSGLVSEVKKNDTSFIDSLGIPRRVISASYAKKIINAHSKIGVPIILVISVPNGARHGLHAITVSGFNQSAPESIPPQPEVSFQAQRIEKFYAHDDQFGPFVRVEFIGEHRIKTPWSEDPNNAAMIVNAIVPVYPKIRISYEDIEVIVRGLDGLFTPFFNSLTLTDLIWDIKLELSESFKEYINQKLNPDDYPDKIKYLKKSMPRFIWSATCYIGEFRILSFIFDATGVSNAMLGLAVVSELPEETREELKEYLNSNYGTGIEDIFNHPATREYYKFFSKKL